jgi:hypothetical protein
MTHQGDPDFLAGLDELRALHLSKGGDYADTVDPLRNYVNSSMDAGIEPWRGALCRMNEKYHRITNLLNKGGDPNHESIEDTLMDLAAIALIVRSLRRRVTARPTGSSRGPLQGLPTTTAKRRPSCQTPRKP